MTDNRSDPEFALVPVTKAVGQVPTISAEAYQHIGRYSGAVVLAAFEGIGGLKRLTEWADTNPNDFFTKLLPKIMSRSTQVDVSGSITIDEAISRLERNTVDGEFTEVEEPRKQEWDL